MKMVAITVVNNIRKWQFCLQTFSHSVSTVVVAIFLAKIMAVFQIACFLCFFGLGLLEFCIRLPKP